MRTIDTVIIGAGQAGLAASRVLSEARHEHVLLERRRVGERWLSSSWDSLRLLSPNWMTRLPYWSYSGSEPDGFMTARQVAAFLADYGRSFDAPIQTNTRVELVHLRGDRLEVVANRMRTRRCRLPSNLHTVSTRCTRHAGLSSTRSLDTPRPKPVPKCVWDSASPT